MARPPKLKSKGGYWYSEAGGKPMRFGRVGIVPYAVAEAKWREHLAIVTRPPEPSGVYGDVTVAQLAFDFLAWVREKRGERAHYHRNLHISRWNQEFGKRPAASINHEDWEKFLRWMRSKGYADNYQKKHYVSINALFNWGVKHGKVPPGTRPFVVVEPPKVPLEPLNENDLPTTEEVLKLFEFADVDLDPINVAQKFRSRRPEEYRQGEANPYRGFGDMLRVYHATGARTYELCDVTVGDFQRRARQLILGKHKTVGRQKRPKPRQIALNEEAYSILDRLCHGRESVEAIFWRHRTDSPWDPQAVERRFVKVRRLGKVRESITPYSFRHLWISELLQAGIDIYRVAKMAGNSVEVIETTYGHLRNQDFQDAVKALESFRAKGAS